MPLLLALAACAPTDEPPPAAREPPPDPPAAHDPLAGAQRLCGGHVTGAPLADGSPGAHVSWEAYVSPEPPDVLRARYVTSLGSEPTLARESCVAWQRPPERPVEVIEVCPATASGPWSSCSPPPPGTATVVLLSTMARPDGPAPPR